MFEPVILTKPVVLIRGRYDDLPMIFYATYNKSTNTGTLRDDLTDYDWYCDFKYDVDDENPIFTLSSHTPDLNILVDNSTGTVTMQFDPDDTNLIEIPKSTTMDMPFRIVHFELKAVDASGRPYSVMLGQMRVYQKVTTSDE